MCLFLLLYNQITWPYLTKGGHFLPRYLALTLCSPIDGKAIVDDRSINFIKTSSISFQPPYIRVEKKTFGIKLGYASTQADALSTTQWSLKQKLLIDTLRRINPPLIPSKSSSTRFFQLRDNYSRTQSQTESWCSSGRVTN